MLSTNWQALTQAEKEERTKSGIYSLIVKGGKTWNSETRTRTYLIDTKAASVNSAEWLKHHIGYTNFNSPYICVAARGKNGEHPITIGLTRHDVIHAMEILLNCESEYARVISNYGVKLVEKMIAKCGTTGSYQTAQAYYYTVHNRHGEIILYRRESGYTYSVGYKLNSDVEYVIAD